MNQPTFYIAVGYTAILKKEPKFSAGMGVFEVNKIQTIDELIELLITKLRKDKSDFWVIVPTSYSRITKEEYEVMNVERTTVIMC